jgi:hypothetical protein
MRRPRGPGGRFLTADEVASIEHGAETKRESTSKYRKKFATCDDSSSDAEFSESEIEIRELQAQTKFFPDQTDYFTQMEASISQEISTI